MNTQKKKGFTLLELLGVIVIVGVLVAIAIPAVRSLTAKISKDGTMASFRVLVNQVSKNAEVDGFSSKEETEYYSVSNDMFRELVRGQYPESGVFVLNNNTLIQANVCYNLSNGFKSYGYDIDGDTYKYFDDERFCEYKSTKGENGIFFINTDDLNFDTKLYDANYILGDGEERDSNNYGLITIAAEYTETGKAETFGTGYLSSKVKTYTYSPNNINNNSIAYQGNLFSSKSNVLKVANRRVFGEDWYILSKELKSPRQLKHQGTTGLCWDYTGTSLLENRIEMQSGKVIDLSESQIDYFSAYNSLEGGNYQNQFASYRGESELTGGGNYSTYYYTLRTGLAIQAASKFGDSSLVERKPLNDSDKIYSIDNVSYYADNVRLWDFSSDHNISKIQTLIKNGGVGVSICHSDVENLTADSIQDYVEIRNNDIVPDGSSGDKPNYTNAYIARDDYGGATAKECKTAAGLDAGHGVFLIGWDNDSEITFKGKTTRGFWIARSTYAGTERKIYIPYGYRYMYNYEMITIEHVRPRNSDYNNTYTNNNEIKNGSGKYISFVLKKPNTTEQIYGVFDEWFSSGDNSANILSRHNVRQATAQQYIIDVKDYDECKRYGENSSLYKVSGNVVYKAGTSQSIGVAYTSNYYDDGYLYKEYKEINNSYLRKHTFKNNYCLIGNTSNIEAHHREITLFTKTISRDSSANIINAFYEHTIAKGEISIVVDKIKGKDTVKINAIDKDGNGVSLPEYLLNEYYFNLLRESNRTTIGTKLRNGEIEGYTMFYFGTIPYNLVIEYEGYKKVVPINGGVTETSVINQVPPPTPTPPSSNTSSNSNQSSSSSSSSSKTSFIDVVVDFFKGIFNAITGLFKRK